MTDTRDLVTDATSLAQHAVEKFGGVDGPVNNARIRKRGWIEQLTDAQVDRMRASGAKDQPAQDGDSDQINRAKGKHQ